MQNRKGITLIEGIVVTVIIIFLFLIFIPTGDVTHLKRRLICGTNLKGLSYAINVYASEYDNKYPVQGAGIYNWGTTTTGWDNPKKDWEDSSGTLTVASSLFLLVREADANIKAFVCTASDQTPSKNRTRHDMVELWDFGANPTDHQSYAYQFPYGKFPANGKSPAGNAIMADRNPWFDKTLTASNLAKENQKTFLNKVSLIDFVAGSGNWQFQIGNTKSHDRQGQNVLFNDGHVSFEKRPDIGTRYDNIYTIGGDTETERRIGTPPTAESIDSANEEDSLLVNDR